MPNSPGNPISIMDFKSLEQFELGQVLLIDKPLGWTSFDVVNKVRYQLKRALGIKKIKVGHAGTLDPLATGVLVLCTGKATKQIDQFQSDDKHYTAQIRLGATTPCLDAELPVDQWTPAHHLTDESIHEAAKTWTGKIEQIPPLFSAKKIDGQKAYAVARQGGELKMRPAHVHIHEFNIKSIIRHEIDGHPIVDVEAQVECSKGTYIRSLARDLGETLGVGGHLIGLERVASGPFQIGQCMSLEQLIQVIEDLGRDQSSKPVDL